MLSPHSASPQGGRSLGDSGAASRNKTLPLKCGKPHTFTASTTTIPKRKKRKKVRSMNPVPFWNHLSHEQDCKCTNKHRLVSNHCLVCLKCSLARSMYHFGSSDPCLFPQVSLPPSISQLGEELDGCHGLVSSSDWGVASWHRTEARGNA